MSIEGWKMLSFMLRFHLHPLSTDLLSAEVSNRYFIIKFFFNIACRYFVCHSKLMSSFRMGHKATCSSSKQYLRRNFHKLWFLEEICCCCSFLGCSFFHTQDWWLQHPWHRHLLRIKCHTGRPSRTHQQAPVSLPEFCKKERKIQLGP